MSYRQKTRNKKQLEILKDKIAALWFDFGTLVLADLNDLTIITEEQEPITKNDLGRLEKYFRDELDIITMVVFDINHKKPKQEIWIDYIPF